MKKKSALIILILFLLIPTSVSAYHTSSQPVSLEQSAQQSIAYEIEDLEATRSFNLPDGYTIISFTTKAADEVLLSISADSGELVYSRLLSGLTPGDTKDVYWFGQINNSIGKYKSGSRVCGGIYNVSLSGKDGSALSENTVQIKVKNKLSAPSELSLELGSKTTQPYGIDIDVLATTAIARWSSVSYATGYEFKLYCSGKLINKRTLPANITGVNLTHYIEKYGHTRYEFSVKALGDLLNSSGEAKKSGSIYIKDPYGSIAIESGYYDSFFDNSALLGDSISDGMRIYSSYMRRSNPQFLGTMQFLTATSYNLNYATASTPSKAVKYKGRKMLPQDALAAMGAEKVFIMIGMNDVFRDIERNIEKYKVLVSNIYKENPDIQIFILGVSPIVSSAQRSGFRNSRVDSFNGQIAQMCSGLNITYIDMSALKNGGSGLPKTYSSDNFVHLSRSGLKVYTEILRQTAKDCMDCS